MILDARFLILDNFIHPAATATTDIEHPVSSIEYPVIYHYIWYQISLFYPDVVRGAGTIKIRFFCHFDWLKTLDKPNVE